MAKRPEPRKIHNDDLMNLGSLMPGHGRPVTQRERRRINNSDERD